MFNAFYGLSHNPFDKQLLKENDSFLSSDHKAMMDRFNYLKDIWGIGDAAISAVHSYSHGNPRLIDNVMTYTLDLGTQMQRQVLDTEVLMLAIEAQSLF